MWWCISVDILCKWCILDFQVMIDEMIYLIFFKKYPRCIWYHVTANISYWNHAKHVNLKCRANNTFLLNKLPCTSVLHQIGKYPLTVMIITCIYILLPSIISFYCLLTGVSWPVVPCFTLFCVVILRDSFFHQFSFFSVHLIILGIRYIARWWRSIKIR